ncbi:MAG: hypothetical protein ACR2PS_14280, partial [Pseudomonadales bacterium]
MAATVNDKLAQIEQHTVQNKRQRSPALELELVELRHQAAQAMVASNNTEGHLAKTSAADLFTGCNGLPKIDGAELSADTLASGILNHGALLVRSLFNAAQIRYLLDSVEQASTDQQAGKLRLGCSPRALFDLLEVYQQCGLLET